MCAFSRTGRARVRDASRGPGDRNFGGVLRYALADGYADLGKRKKKDWRESSNRRRFRSMGPYIIYGNGRKMKKGRKGSLKTATTLLYLYCLLMSFSSDLSLCLLQRPPRVAVVAAFESCLLTTRTERGVGLHWQPSEKGTDFRLLLLIVFADASYYCWAQGGTCITA